MTDKRSSQAHTLEEAKRELKIIRTQKQDFEEPLKALSDELSAKKQQNEEISGVLTRVKSDSGFTFKPPF